MLVAIFAALAVALLTYLVMSYLDEQAAIKKRVSILANGRLANVSSSLNKEQILAKIHKNEQREKSKKSGQTNNFTALIERAGLRLFKHQIEIACLGFGLFVGLVTWIGFGNLVVALVIAALATFVVPRIILAIMVARREKAFIDELPNALDMLSRGLRAGIPLGTCLKQISETAAEPLKSEFSHVIDIHKLGLPLAEAIRRMPERIDSMDLRFFTIVVEIQQKSGGNLAEIVENISGVIRARKELRAKIRALISEAKVSSIIIGVLPVLFAALSYKSDAEAFSHFWTEPVGQILLIVSLLLYSIGTGLFVKIASVKA